MPQQIHNNSYFKLHSTLTYTHVTQIYPQLNKDRPLTRLQERLIKKLGNYAFPFYFEVPPHCPASVSLQPAPGDTGMHVAPVSILFFFSIVN